MTPKLVETGGPALMGVSKLKADGGDPPTTEQAGDEVHDLREPRGEAAVSSSPGGQGALPGLATLYWEKLQPGVGGPAEVGAWLLPFLPWLLPFHHGPSPFLPWLLPLPPLAPPLPPLPT